MHFCFWIIFLQLELYKWCRCVFMYVWKFKLFSFRFIFSTCNVSVQFVFLLFGPSVVHSRRIIRKPVSEYYPSVILLSLWPTCILSTLFYLCCVVGADWYGGVYPSGIESKETCFAKIASWCSNRPKQKNAQHFEEMRECYREYFSGNDLTEVISKITIYLLTTAVKIKRLLGVNNEIIEEDI